MKRECNTCAFCVEVTMPGNITKQPICAKNPPTPVMMQSQAGMQVIGMQPPIPQAQICGEWIDKDETFL